jgi:hypothetical protein
MPIIVPMPTPRGTERRVKRQYWLCSARPGKAADELRLLHLLQRRGVVANGAGDAATHDAFS